MGNKKPKAILLGPFVGELYWEAGRFAPMLPNMIKTRYRGINITYIVLTREDRFDLYGRHANILVPLRITGDYENLQPNCFKLNGFSVDEYQKVVNKFRKKYKEEYNIIEHLYPNIKSNQFLNKNQYPRNILTYNFKPRDENYDIVNKYLPKDKPLIVLAPRFRKGFRRNWKYWHEFYNLLSKDDIMNDFNFIICGKKGEYIPDVKHRFLDMNDMEVGIKSSLIGLLLIILENTFFTFGSQSAIPNLSLLYNIDVLEFGCQKALHTKTYNVKNTPITFIENRKYDISHEVIFKKMKKLVYKKRRKKYGS